ncbi:MAG TPA: hypothetical protein ENH40_06580 [Nitrospirae bacterium]|nr:hypothetical protein [Nitrospirota bacterium]
MAKKIAILIRDRQHEGLRMAVGATLADDEINVFIMDKKIVPDDELTLNLETLTDFDIKVFSNNPENQFEQKSTEEIAASLPEYDLVIPY